MSFSHNMQLEIDKIDNDHWCDIVACFKDANIYQTYSYTEICWGDRQVSNIVLKYNNKIVAAALVRIIKIPVFRTGIAYIKWGPMWLTNEGEKCQLYLKEIIEHIINEYARKRKYALIVIPFQGTGESVIVDTIFEQAGFMKSTENRQYQTIVMDMLPPLDEIRKNMKKKWRRNLICSEQEPITVIDGYEEELFNIVENLYKEMITRKKINKDIKIKDIKEVQRKLSQDDKMRIFICNLDGIPISARVVSLMGNTAVDMIAASGNTGLNLNCTYLILWKVIEWLKEKECHWYELGGIDKIKNPGGYQFKTGLAGNNTNIVAFNEYNYFTGKKDELLLKLFNQVRIANYGTENIIKYMYNFILNKGI